jgi:hypothetical protein
MEQFKGTSLNFPSSPASRIRHIGPFKWGFAGPSLGFAQGLLPFHNSLPIRILDSAKRTHDSLEF